MLFETVLKIPSLLVVSVFLAMETLLDSEKLLKKIRIFLEMVRFNNIASKVDSNGSIEDWLKEK